VVDAATDDFLSPEPELDPEVDPPDEPESEELEDSDDFPASDVVDEPSADGPLEPFAAPSLPAATVLDPLRLSVR
jgi:hypothetical protein